MLLTVAFPNQSVTDALHWVLPDRTDCVLAFILGTPLPGNGSSKPVAIENAPPADEARVPLRSEAAHENEPRLCA